MVTVRPQRYDAETTEQERAELKEAIAKTKPRSTHLDIGTAAGRQALLVGCDSKPKPDHYQFQLKQ
jgi:hypothetical protein